MIILRLAVIAILIIGFMMGCSGSYGELKTQTEGDSKATHKELFDNWPDYHIWYRFESTVVMFDPKDDDKKIIVPSRWWGTVKDQETWAKFVEANTNSDGKINSVGTEYPMTGVREIWGPDNQLYGFIIHRQGDGFSARLVEDNTLRLYYLNRLTVMGPD